MKRNNILVLSKELLNSKNGSISNLDKNQKGEIEQNMKNIRKRKDGRWEARIQINGNRYSLFAKTQTECIKKLNNLKKEVKHYGIKQSPYPAKFADFCLYWFDNYKKNNIVKASVTNYLYYIKNELSKIKYALKELTVDILQRFLNSYPPTRVREYIFMILKQILKKAYELDLTPKNYGDFLIKGKIQRTKIGWFNLQDQKLILQNLTDDLFSLSIYTLLLTGCRPSELRTIKLENIKNNLVLVEGTKTKNAKRWIKISSFLEDRFKKQKENEIFKNLDMENLRYLFRTFLKKLNITGTLYMLRHTFATNLFYLGVPDKERQSYMGHSSSVLTNDVYTDFDPTITKEDILNLYKDLYPSF